MKTTLYHAPVPAGTPLVAASPAQMLETLNLRFPTRFAATGITIYEEDLPTLRPLTLSPTGDVNAAAWREIIRGVEVHGAVRVWGHDVYKEEA